MEPQQLYIWGNQSRDGKTVMRTTTCRHLENNTRRRQQQQHISFLWKGMCCSLEGLVPLSACFTFEITFRASHLTMPESCSARLRPIHRPCESHASPLLIAPTARRTNLSWSELLPDQRGCLQDCGLVKDLGDWLLPLAPLAPHFEN